jgi:hypothetical protein
MVHLHIIPAYDRTYYYILRQSQKPSWTLLTVTELTLLTLYLATFGFFVCLTALRIMFPLMIRLGDYATHDAGRLGRIFAILGVTGIWSFCVLWIFAFPLIPGIGGLIARNAS